MQHLLWPDQAAAWHTHSSELPVAPAERDHLRIPLGVGRSRSRPHFTHTPVVRVHQRRSPAFTRASHPSRAPHPDLVGRRPTPVIIHRQPLYAPWHPQQPAAARSHRRNTRPLADTVAGAPSARMPARSDGALPARSLPMAVRWVQPCGTAWIHALAPRWCPLVTRACLREGHGPKCEPRGVGLLLGPPPRPFRRRWPTPGHPLRSGSALV